MSLIVRFNKDSIEKDLMKMSEEGKRLGIDYTIEIEQNEVDEILRDGDSISGSWKETEFFKPHWEMRTEQMSKLISDDSASIMDCGCGEGKLRNYIPSNMRYMGVDYCKRPGIDNLIYDFNIGEFPEIYVDTMFLAGILEYIDDYKSFIINICKYCRKEIILSYCILELFRNIAERRSIGQKCFLYSTQLIKLFEENGYFLTHSEFWNTTSIFRFIKRI